MGKAWADATSGDELRDEPRDAVPTGGDGSPADLCRSKPLLRTPDSGPQPQWDLEKAVVWS